jgi:hypothetical protein
MSSDTRHALRWLLVSVLAVAAAAAPAILLPGF